MYLYSFHISSYLLGHSILVKKTLEKFPVRSVEGAAI